MDTLTDLHLRPALLAEGYTDPELMRMRRAGVLTTVRDGAYLRADDERLGVPEARHSLLVRSTVPRLRSPAAVSHQSAGVLHGLPAWSVALDRVHVTRAGTGGGRTSGKLCLHVSPLDERETIRIGGLTVTTPERTVDDVARTLPLEQALPIVDQALRTGLCSPEGLAGARERAAHWPGGPQAARVIGFADGRSTNVGESRSRLALHLAGLPAPELQWEVRTARGRYLGRVDFAWPGFGVVGEFDGRAKYTEYLRPGQTEADAVWAEKRREDAIRSTGLWVVRWGWSDLDHFDRIVALLRARFAAA